MPPGLVALPARPGLAPRGEPLWRAPLDVARPVPVRRGPPPGGGDEAAAGASEVAVGGEGPGEQVGETETVGVGRPPAARLPCGRPAPSRAGGLAGGPVRRRVGRAARRRPVRRRRG